ncbi:MAG: hypothetical protein KC609_17740 [Myxococcales bacterium]|nr:hypothetical protein [Myxococcales bacterium]
MGKNVAIVAHFDARNRLDENFRLVLASLWRVFDSIVLVTTCDLPECETASLAGVTTIRRPNVGYDFYSYRVGLASIAEGDEPENVLLLNSSIVLVQPATFEQMLQQMLVRIQRYDVIAATESEQIDLHLQSFLLLLRGSLVRSSWLTDFFSKIEPLNSKLELILSYEIGLSRLLRAHNARMLSWFEPDAATRVIGHTRWMSVVARAAEATDWLTFKPLLHWRDVNWTQFAAEAVCRQLGFVKAELLRNNPHGISTDFISELAPPEVWETIEALGSARGDYASGEDGISVLRDKASPLPTNRRVQYGISGAKGVRVAVVVHLYYIDLLDEICGYLKHIVEPFDLFVTTPFEGDVHRILNRTSSLAHSVTVWLTENRGRDIGPFTALFRSGSLDGYLAVLKLHSKKSTYSEQGAAWRRQIYGSLVGDSLTVRRTLRLFERGDVGIVGSHAFFLSDEQFWGANYDAVKRLLTLAGTLTNGDEPTLGFFAGSMFWFSPKALAAFAAIPEASLHFEAENGKQDGTLAHAIERIFCSIAHAARYRVTTLRLEGQDITEIDTRDNRVPVL